MNKLLLLLLPSFGLLYAVPSPAQSARGSLVIWIVSRQADYVVIGAESRTVRSNQKGPEDRSCKIISLGGDTLFYETGISEMQVGQQPAWSSESTARRAYRSLDRRDAPSLAAEWGNRALRWFSAQSDQTLRDSANRVTGILVSGGFVHFDRNVKLSLVTTNLTFGGPNRRIRVETSSTAPGHIGASGRATDLVREFFAGETARAVRAAAVVGGVAQIGVKPEKDARLIRAAIQFAIDHAGGADRSALGGDIDLAVLSEAGKISWLARKYWCSSEDVALSR